MINLQLLRLQLFQVANTFNIVNPIVPEDYLSDRVDNIIFCCK